MAIKLTMVFQSNKPTLLTNIVFKFWKKIFAEWDMRKIMNPVTNDVILTSSIFVKFWYINELCQNWVLLKITLTWVTVDIRVFKKILSTLAFSIFLIGSGRSRYLASSVCFSQLNWYRLAKYRNKRQVCVFIPPSHVARDFSLGKILHDVNVRGASRCWPQKRYFSKSD